MVSTYEIYNANITIIIIKHYCYYLNTAPKANDNLGKIFTTQNTDNTFIFHFTKDPYQSK